MCDYRQKGVFSIGFVVCVKSKSICTTNNMEKNAYTLLQYRIEFLVPMRKVSRRGACALVFTSPNYLLHTKTTVSPKISGQYKCSVVVFVMSSFFMVSGTCMLCARWQTTRAGIVHAL